jgi:hypothetical protein
MTRTGEPLPADYLQKRVEKIRTGQEARTARIQAQATAPKEEPAPKEPVLAMHGPAARVKALKSIKARMAEKKRIVAKVDAVTEVSDNRRYEKLAERGIFRCPECSRTSHKIRDFVSPKELGKHRRFAHGVLGRKHLKVKKAIEQIEVALTNHEKIDVTKCPYPDCGRSFKNAHGLSIHIHQAHKAGPNKPSTLVPTAGQELIHANGNTQGTTATHHVNGKAARRSDYDDAETAQAIAVAHLTGNIESLILATANEYDLPPRQFARRVILTLGERHS